MVGSWQGAQASTAADGPGLSPHEASLSLDRAASPQPYLARQATSRRRLIASRHVSGILKNPLVSSSLHILPNVIDAFPCHLSIAFPIHHIVIDDLSP